MKTTRPHRKIRTPNTRGQATTLESLEARRLMSSNLTSLMAGQQMGFFLAPIIVNGTENSDFITVSYSNNPVLGSRVVVRVNPSNTNPGYVVFPLPAQPVQINGLGGNDVIRYSGSLGASIYGGEGYDKITGGAGSDYISGDGGNDFIDGGLGSDFMSGGIGADTVDYSMRTANLWVRADGFPNDGETGESDNVYHDVEILVGGSGNDHLNFFQTPGAWHKLVGNGGSDTLVGGDGADLIEGGPGNNLLKGNYGDDVLFGGIGNDVLRGDYGKDLLVGAQGHDLLYGDGNTDTLWGDEGNDTLNGGYAEDILYGGKDNDVLRGDESNDMLYGQDGNDRVYGGEGADFAFGGNGHDGLFGGLGIDELTGGADTDRFLFQSGDKILDLTAVDARVKFVNGQQITTDFSGQNGTYTFAGRNWRDDEIESVDIALNVMHNAVGNTRLLKRMDRTEISFIRQGAVTTSTGGTFTASAWNSNDGTIKVVSPSIGTILHEVGHNWDTEFDSAGWNSLSGWTRSDMAGNTNYQKGAGNDGWWHLTTAQFASSYARTNPYEDFAESFEVNMLKRGNLPNVDTVVAAKNTFIDNMVSALAAQA